MPGSSADQGVLQQTVDGFAQRVDDYAQGIANRIGAPLSGVQLSPEEAVQRWNFTPLGDTASADAKFFALTLQGMTPGQALEQVYPMRPGLFAGQDINESIAKAQQIAGWAADAVGQDRPDRPLPFSTMPNSILQDIITKAHQAASPATPPLGVGGATPIGPAPTGAPPAPPQPAPGLQQPGAGPTLAPALMAALGAPPPAPVGAAPPPAPAPPAIGPTPGPLPPMAPGQSMPMPIPAMAEGGIVTQPTLAMIGEQGPEAVVPLTDPQQAMTDYTHLGMNIDPLNPSAAPDPKTGFGMDRISQVRAVSRNDPRQTAYLDQLRANGKQVMSVVTPESNGYLYPGSSAVQIGNEPDVQGTAMSAQDYANMWNQYRQQFDGKAGSFVMGGLGSGLGNAKSYLDQVWPLLQTKPDQVAIHLYDGDVAQSQAEIQDIQNELKNLGSNAKVAVTEWNKPNDQIWAMMNMMNQMGVSWSSYYPYSSGQNPSTTGATTAQKQPTAQGASLVSGAAP